jgi:hypothetical protein
MSDVSKARALVEIIERDWPGLLPPELAEGTAEGAEGVAEVLSALLAILPPETQAGIEREAGADTLH